MERVIYCCEIMIALYLVSAALAYILNLVMLQITKRIVSTMRSNIFDRLMRLPVSFFDTAYNITDVRWSLLIPLSDRQVEKLKDRSTIRVKFLKDDMTQNGDFSIITIDGDKYGQIDFNNGQMHNESDLY